MNQYRAGMLVRVKETGKLFEVDSIAENGRVWLVNSAEIIDASADAIQLVSDNRRASRPDSDKQDYRCH